MIELIRNSNLIKFRLSPQDSILKDSINTPMTDQEIEFFLSILMLPRVESPEDEAGSFEMYKAIGWSVRVGGYAF